MHSCINLQRGSYSRQCCLPIHKDDWLDSTLGVSSSDSQNRSGVLRALAGRLYPIRRKGAWPLSKSLGVIWFAIMLTTSVFSPAPCAIARNWHLFLDSHYLVTWKFLRDFTYLPVHGSSEASKQCFVPLIIKRGGSISTGNNIERSPLNNRND